MNLSISLIPAVIFSDERQIGKRVRITYAPTDPIGIVYPQETIVCEVAPSLLGHRIFRIVPTSVQRQKSPLLGCMALQFNPILTAEASGKDVGSMDSNDFFKECGKSREVINHHFTAVRERMEHLRSALHNAHVILTMSEEQVKKLHRKLTELTQYVVTSATSGATVPFYVKGSQKSDTLVVGQKLRVVYDGGKGPVVGVITAVEPLIAADTTTE